MMRELSMILQPSYTQWNYWPFVTNKSSKILLSNEKDKKKHNTPKKILQNKNTKAEIDMGNTYILWHEVIPIQKDYNK